MILPQSAEQLLTPLVQQAHDAYQPQTFIAAALARQILIPTGDSEPP